MSEILQNPPARSHDCHLAANGGYREIKVGECLLWSRDHDRQQLAEKSLMEFRLQTCHPENATAAIGQRGGIRAAGQLRPFGLAAY